MPFSAIVSRLLISCPSDIAAEDITVIQQTITRWNGIYAESFGATVIPIHWSIHAAAQFGSAPQEILNKQIVDRCDLGLAIFANRMGTPTSTARSGTAEEVQRLNAAGKFVGILRCRRLVDPKLIDTKQVMALDAFIHEVKKKSLILEYADSLMLSHQVDTFLAMAIARDRGRAEIQLQNA